MQIYRAPNEINELIL